MQSHQTANTPEDTQSKPIEATPPAVSAPAPTRGRDISKTLISNTIVLGCDFAVTSMPYGMALKAEAMVRRPQLRDLAHLQEWTGAYKRTWGILKCGFWPTFLLEVAASETLKQWGSPTFAKYSDFIMPGIIGAGTAPAVSFAAINARYKLQLDLIQEFKKHGLSGITRKTGGPVSIGLREALCYMALHSDTAKLEKQIADGSASYAMTSFLFRHKDGSPTKVTKLAALAPDGLMLLAGQPLTMFAVNAATLKHKMQQASRPGLTSPAALLRWQLNFGKMVCDQIMSEGKKSGLSSMWSFSPGVVVRTLSLFGTLAVFKNCLAPVDKVVADNITHRKN